MGEIPKLYLGSGGGGGYSISQESNQEKKKKHEETGPLVSFSQGFWTDASGTVRQLKEHPGGNIYTPEEIAKAEKHKGRAYHEGLPGDVRETEVNPEVRTQFEAGEKPTPPKLEQEGEAKKQGFGDRLLFGPKPWTDEKGVKHEVVENIFPGMSIAPSTGIQAAKLGMQIKTINPKILAGTGASGLTIGGAFAYASSQASWAALDNIMGGASIVTRDIKSELPYATPEQRRELYLALDETEKNIRIAEEVIDEATMRNPFVMAQAKLWRSGISQAKISILRNIEYIRNYDPYMDQRSNESRSLNVK